MENLFGFGANSFEVIFQFRFAFSRDFCNLLHILFDKSFGNFSNFTIVDQWEDSEGSKKLA